MTVVTLPEGARAKTHLHRGIETAVYVLDGEAEMHFGERLRELVRARAASRDQSLGVAVPRARRAHRGG